MADITNHKLLYLKGLLFLILGLLASALILVDSLKWQTVLLLAIAIWSFSRLYYFMFYVIERYIDPGYRFAGILDFLKYVWGRRRISTPPGAITAEPSESRGQSS